MVKARKEYGVEYPWLYAPESNKHHKEFNSAQRAHQNTLESYSLVMLQMCLCGLVYPITSAICGKYSFHCFLLFNPLTYRLPSSWSIVHSTPLLHLSQHTQPTLHLSQYWSSYL